MITIDPSDVRYIVIQPVTINHWSSGTKPLSELVLTYSKLGP